jgi:hypothetical protein
MKETTPAEGGFRTGDETEARARLADLFDRSTDPTATRLDEFPKYVRRQRITRLLALYELFKQVVEVKGSIIDCGVFRGFSLMAFAHFSAILEPTNLTRRVYGFDTFGGFSSVSAKDGNRVRTPLKGELAATEEDEIRKLSAAHDQNRFLGHLPKMELVVGDATKTIPAFVRGNPHLVVSLLFLDFDLYEPTKAAIESFLPRMPAGSIIAFDELDNPIWPGETAALLETIGIGRLRMRRLSFDPYIGYATLEPSP